jgi:hypothetical protein
LGRGFVKFSLPLMTLTVEGHEGVKLELGFGFFYWKNGISCIGTGIRERKNNRIENWINDLSRTATEAMGFALLNTGIESNFGQGNGHRNPLQEPLS